MFTFSDYRFYSEEYHGKLSEEDYKSSVHTAFAEILSQTNNRAKSAPETMKDAVKLCECELVDIITAYKKSDDLLPKGVDSVTNDKYSVSRGGSNADGSRAKEKRAVCVRYLQTPENLMCWWI